MEPLGKKMTMTQSLASDFIFNGGKDKQNQNQNKTVLRLIIIWEEKKFILFKSWKNVAPRTAL